MQKLIPQSTQKGKKKASSKDRRQICPICKATILGGHLARHLNQSHLLKKEKRQSKALIPKKRKLTTKKPSKDMRTSTSITTDRYSATSKKSKNPPVNDTEDTQKIKKERPVKIQFEKAADRIIEYSDKIEAMDYENAKDEGIMQRKLYYESLNRASKSMPEVISENIHSLRAYRYLTKMLMCRNQMLQGIIEKKNQQIEEFQNETGRNTPPKGFYGFVPFDLRTPEEGFDMCLKAVCPLTNHH